ncbi:MAG: hypothetical protein IPF99_05290 [Deltaproteobacteria bacterium]|nr:hypothetical protein [Deltaproteobacteria bacterium]
MTRPGDRSLLLRGRWLWAIVLCGASTLTLGGCPERGALSTDDVPEKAKDAAPDEEMLEDASTADEGPSMDAPDAGTPEDLGVTGPDVAPPADADPPADTATPADTGPADAGPPDSGPTRPACPPVVAATRTDPCPGVPACGLPTRGVLTVTGASAAYSDLQVRVVLPPAVRTASGPECDKMVFRTASGAWAPHFVTDCAMGVVWVRVPTLVAGAPATLSLHYGGSTPVPAANSYDDTFDRVPMHAANTLGAYTFDEGAGSRTCPAVGTVPFDAYIHQTPYDAPPVDVAVRPPLWSTLSPPSLLNASARFTRGQHSLNFPSVPVLKASGLSSPNRVINWQSASSAPFNTARTQLTVGVWVKPETPSNHFNDNFQTVVCFGMPDQATRAAFWRLPETDHRIVDNSIFNPWAIFFRGDGEDDTLYQGNSCVEPCTDVMQYAHVTTVEPLTSDRLINQWHFLALTIDTTARPHTVRRSFYDGHTYDYPRDLNLFPPGGRYCPADPNPAHGQPNPLVGPCYPPDLPDGGAGTPTCWQPCSYLCPGTVDGMVASNTCVHPPEAPIQYPPAPVVIGADMNDGEPQLGIHGVVDDLFILGRAVNPAEMDAYRERRQYCPDTLTATVTP